MNFEQSLAYLYGLGHETVVIKLGLANTEKLLDGLGRPQDGFAKVQVAGTNGKGSTCAFLESICHAAGLRTGLNISPHLTEITERIRINTQDSSPEEFARYATQAFAVAEQLRAQGTRPTFFEHLTAMALVAFREAQVDIGILETGLGGRLDATTVAGAEVVGITPIHYDHTRFLGDTFASIAAEKAAIIRPGATAVIAPQPDEAMAVIRARCNAVGVTPGLIEENAEVVGLTADGRVSISFTTPQDRYENVQLSLRGRHQIVNALTAVRLAEALRTRGLDISHAAVGAGLATARQPGRLELRPGSPFPILLDGAHNEHGATALRDYLQEFVHTPFTLVFGMMSDKKLDKIGPLLFPLAHRIVFTQPNQPRAATPESIYGALPVSVTTKSLITSSVADALVAAHSCTPPGGMIVATGSLYLVGEALGWKNPFVRAS